MDYIEKLFSRLNLQHIREFLLYGTEAVEITEQSYRERLDTSQQPVLEMIQKAYPCELESPEVDLFYQALSAAQEVYLEIGMRAGAILTAQLLEKGKK